MYSAASQNLFSLGSQSFYSLNILLCRFSKFLLCRISKFLIYRISKFLICRISKFLFCEITKFLLCSISKFLLCRISKFLTKSVLKLRGPVERSAVHLQCHAYNSHGHASKVKRSLALTYIFKFTSFNSPILGQSFFYLNCFSLNFCKYQFNSGDHMQVFKQNVYNQFLGEKKILVLKQLYSKWLRQVRF